MYVCVWTPIIPPPKITGRATLSSNKLENLEKGIYIFLAYNPRLDQLWMKTLPPSKGFLARNSMERGGEGQDREGREGRGRRRRI